MTDALAEALFTAWDLADRAAMMEAGALPPEPLTFAEVTESTQREFRGIALLLQSAGAVTMLEVPEGIHPEPAHTDPAVVGQNTANLRSAVNVLSISLGFLRDNSGALALAGHFVGNPRDDPEATVASAWVLSQSAAMGLLVQIINAAAAVDPTLALGMAATVARTARLATENLGGLVVPRNGAG